MKVEKSEKYLRHHLRDDCLWDWQVLLTIHFYLSIDGVSIAEVEDPYEELCDM